MKEIYEKPQFKVECFAVSQNVAQSCGYRDEYYEGRPTHDDKVSCGWDDGWEILWLSTPACNSIVDEQYVVDEYCYNNPNGSLTIFAS